MFKQNINIKKNSGFTLVEIAIVLVIIGLLIGGVLKGQEMINNAKIKRIGTDFDGVAAAIFSYQDRYRALPGDDLGASRWGLSGTDLGDGDGTYNTQAWDSTTDTHETRLFWRHLRYSNLIPGDVTTYKQPSNAYGGIIGVQVSNFGLTGTVICMNNIDGANALIIDTQLDDGKPDTGSLRAHTSSTNATPIADSYGSTTNTYTICKKL